MYIVGGFGRKGYTFNTQDEIDQLMRKVTTDVAFTLRQVTASRVIFAVDSKSWRKEIEIEENEGYKGNRSKSDHINWDNVYTAMNDFCDIMEEKGLVSTKIQKAEADDIMALWRDELLYRKYEHVVLVSGDQDIQQLVNDGYGDPNKLVEGDNLRFATVFNPFTQGKNSTKKLFGSSKFSEWLNTEGSSGDIFNRNTEPDKEAFVNLVNEHKVKLETINGEDIALQKIFCGDDGDNVPAIYTWLGKTSKGDTKEYRITPSKYKKLIELLNETTGTQVDSTDILLNTNSLIDTIEEFLVQESGKPLPFNIKDRVKRQLKLVLLNKDVFPKEIIDEFDRGSDQALAKQPKDISGWYMNTLLAGTKYLDENYERNSQEASIFKEIDDMVDNISQSLF